MNEGPRTTLGRPIAGEWAGRGRIRKRSQKHQMRMKTITL